jgi:hypothetical protein
VPAAFEPVLTAGIGGRHHAVARAGRRVGPRLARPAPLQRRRFRSPQEAAQGLAADWEAFFDTKFFRPLESLESRYWLRARLKINSFWGVRSNSGLLHFQSLSPVAPLLDLSAPSLN